jgi:hypothetical protein
VIASNRPIREIECGPVYLADLEPVAVGCLGYSARRKPECDDDVSLGRRGGGLTTGR